MRPYWSTVHVFPRYAHNRQAPTACTTYIGMYPTLYTFYLFIYFLYHMYLSVCARSQRLKERRPKRSHLHRALLRHRLAHSLLYSRGVPDVDTDRLHHLIG